MPIENVRGPWWRRGPLGSADFRRLWMGEGVSVAGTQFHFVALPWLILESTGSGAALGRVLMTAALPRAALMLVGGVITDRISPRALMIGSNLLRGALAGALATAVLADRVPLVLLYTISGLSCAPNALPLSRQTAIPDVSQ